MVNQPSVLPIRRPVALSEPERRVRILTGADGKLFGGWGVRF